jgi:hypothetical protein
MDPRLLTLLSRLQSSRFTDLAGSEARAVIRIAAPLLNEAAATFAASASAVRDVTIRPRASNHIEVSLKLAKPAFLPSLKITVVIEQQPELPGNPELALRLSGAGGMMRLAGPAISSFGALPPGVRLDGDHVFVDLRTILHQHGQGELLDYVEQLQVLSEEGSIVLLVQLRVR